MISHTFRFLRSGSYWALRLTAWLIMLVAVLVGIAVAALHYWVLPNVNDHREYIGASISRAAGQTVEIGHIEGGWRRYQPQLAFFDVRVHEAGGQRTLSLERVDTVLSWRSLIKRAMVFELIELAGSDIEVRRDSIGTVWVAGKAIQGRLPGGRSKMLSWLTQQEQILVAGARLTWIDEMRAAPALVIDGVRLQIENLGKTHRFALTGTPPMELASTLTVNGEFSSGDDIADLAAWRGVLNADFEYANLAYAQQWIPLPVTLDSGLGVMHLVMQIQDREVSETRVEVELVNVAGRLVAGAEPFALASLSGKARWSRDERASVLQLTSVSFETTDGLRLAPVDVRVNRERGAENRTELSISSLDLAPVAALSRFLPLNDENREKLMQLRPHGLVEQLDAVWQNEVEGKRFVSATIRVQDLGVTPVGKLPGFEGVSGEFSFGATRGTVALDSRVGKLHLPLVFGEPIPFDYVNGSVSWERRETGFRVDFSDLAFTNEHAAGKASGYYEYPGHGRGNIDVSAALVRADAQYVWRYFPVKIEKTRSWLQQGLVAGHSNRVELRLAGDLDRLPFVDRTQGIFELNADVQDAAIRIGSDWPLIEGVSGEFRISGDRIDINPKAGWITGVDVSQTRVSVLGLGSSQVRLSVDGKAAGQVGQFLNFVANSPVARYTRGATLGMSGEGIGNLALRLDLPFGHVKDISVSGELDLAGPVLSAGPQIPQLSEYAVKVELNEKGVRFRNGRGTLLGGRVRFASRPDDGEAHVIDLSGTASATDVAAFLDRPSLRRMDGNAEWTGSLRFEKPGMRLNVRTTLVGVGSQLPAPLDKLQPTALPLDFELLMRADGKKEILIALDKIGSAYVLTEAGTVQRGRVVFGGKARLPRQDQFIAEGAVNYVDVDGWRAELASLQSGGGESRIFELDSVDVTASQVLFSGRSFSDLRVTGKRLGKSWQLAMSGPQVKGDLLVTPGANGIGRIKAKFATLRLPQREPALAKVEASSQQADVKLPPALDVEVSSLEFDGKPLGRVELLAEPEDARWRLDRLAISNPDGSLDVSGTWRLAARPHVEYVVNIKANDNGKFLKRLGYQESIVGGLGELSGPVSWLGGPFQPDVPTLSGKLKLHAEDGRFAKVDPGAAQLIGILSLQALPRRITLDFKDVFTPGFSFDTIDAEVTISDGIASTNDFRMDGVSARVTMKGQVSLAEETQDLEVHVRPQLSGAAAVAGAAVVNPLVGVATLLVQKVLGDPVEQIASRDYRVTGTWEKPNIERIARKDAAPAPSKPGR